MALDDFAAMMKARELVRMVNPTAIPAPVEAYVERMGAVLKIDMSLADNEPGYNFPHKDKKYICVNGKDSPERQRFTICHELAHIVLGLPSEHQEVASSSYVKRAQAEILCDIFAAELLLPFGLFKPLADKAAISLASIEALASKFVASTMATGSRFAAVLKAPCAFVLSENGKVRYAARSTSLRDASAWIAPRIELPQGSLSAKLRSGTSCDSPAEIEADEWFQHWERGGTLLEEARHLEKWDQTLTLLWFEDEEVPPPKKGTGRDSEIEEDEDVLLKELDGVLPWPGKKRRR
jgi:Zn-dependent peptidase ImmA (M78 family)